MLSLNGKITVAELRNDEDLFQELVDQLHSTSRSVNTELNRHDDDAAVEDIFEYVPDSLASTKVSEARDDDTLIDEIATLANLEHDEVVDTLNGAHGAKYIANVFSFPWPQPNEDDDDVDDHRVGPGVSSTQAEKGRLTVLLVSASPDSHVRLRVDREFRTIIERIRGSRYRDRLNIVQLQAASFDDLRTALMEHEPQVLHFSGHGEPNGSLLFEPRGDRSHVVPKKNFVRLVKALAGGLRLVVLNACHSQVIAAEIPPTIDLAIGMSQSIADSTAIDFAVALYEALAFNKSVQVAFEAAVAGLDEDELELPQLFPLKDLEGKRRQPLLS